MWLSVLRFIPMILAGIGLSDVFGLSDKEIVEIPESNNSISNLLPLIIIGGLVFYLVKKK